MGSAVTERPSRRALVIGYGNSLLGDDGVGPWVAERVALWNRRDVTALAVPQLTPELAARLLEASLVVFVDAAWGEAEVRLQRLEPAAVGSSIGHVCRPAELLSWSRLAYGRAPRAWLLAIPAQRFDLGAALSAACQGAATAALTRLRSFLDTHLDPLGDPAPPQPGVP